MADGSITYQTVKPAFECIGCNAPTFLCDLNENMQCEACGPADLDPEDFAPSEAYLRRWEGTL